MHRMEFEKFVVSIRPLLVNRANAVIGDANSADDIVQDCLLKLWTMRDALDEYDSPEALAMTITHRLALNAIRKQHDMCELQDAAIAEKTISPEEAIIRKERGQEVNEVLAMLPDSQKALITMRHIEGLSNAEIANIIGSSEGAVRTALSRARSRIAEIFTKNQLSNK